MPKIDCTASVPPVWCCVDTDNNKPAGCPPDTESVTKRLPSTAKKRKHNAAYVYELNTKTWRVLSEPELAELNTALERKLAELDKRRDTRDNETKYFQSLAEFYAIRNLKALEVNALSIAILSGVNEPSKQNTVIELSKTAAISLNIFSSTLSDLAMQFANGLVLRGKATKYLTRSPLDSDKIVKSDLKRIEKRIAKVYLVPSTHTYKTDLVVSEKTMRSLARLDLSKIRVKSK